MVDIPRNAADVVPETDDSRRAEREHLEFELLETDRALRNLLEREVGQRYWLRWIAVVTGVAVIAGMAYALAHLLHNTFIGPFHFASSAFSVAMIVAPIASITAITVALFVGAFRKFDDKDLEVVGNGTARALTMFRSN